MSKKLNLITDENKPISIEISKVAEYYYSKSGTSVKEYPYFILTMKDNAAYKISYAYQFKELLAVLKKYNIHGNL